MANELKKAEPQFSVVLMDKLESVEEALPVNFNKAKFVQNALALINDNSSTFQKFSKTQIMAGLLKGAYLGLDFFSREAYLIPYKDQLQFQIDYRGAMKLAKKYSIRPIEEIDAKIVREGDRFEEIIEGGHQSFVFRPRPFSNAPIVGAFAYVRYKDGGMIVDSMSLEELENTRKHSRAKDSMAWQDFTAEMFRKTVIRRVCKRVEIQFETPEQRKLYDDDLAIATSPKEQAEAEIAAGENAEEIIIEDVPQ